MIWNSNSHLEFLLRVLPHIVFPGFYDFFALAVRPGLIVEKYLHWPRKGSAAKLLMLYRGPACSRDIVNLKISIMKTVITILMVLFTGIIACDTPEPTTTNPSGDTTSINSNRMDTTMQSTDTTMRRDSIPGR